MQAIIREQRAILGKDSTTTSLADSAALRGSRVKILHLTHRSLHQHRYSAALPLVSHVVSPSLQTSCSSSLCLLVPQLAGNGLHLRPCFTQHIQKMRSSTYTSLFMNFCRKLQTLTASENQVNGLRNESKQPLPRSRGCCMT